MRIILLQEIVSLFFGGGSDVVKSITSKSLKRPHSSSHEDSLRTGVMGNLGKCKNSSSNGIVSHRKVVELK